MDAAANPNGSAAANVTHNIIWDHKTFEEMLARYAGADPAPFDIETYRCTTIDGWRIKPTEALVDSLINGVRRVIIDAASVTIDMSHKRFYTGFARLAAQINHDECEMAVVRSHGELSNTSCSLALTTSAAATCRSADVRPTTSPHTPGADQPTKPTTQGSAEDTTGSKKPATPSGATPPPAKSTSPPPPATPSNNPPRRSRRGDGKLH